MILVEGCPRSGTSIFAEKVARDLGYDLLFEPWWPWGGQNIDRPDLVVKMPRHFDPTPGLGCDIDDLPDGPTFWVIRHPLDVVASLRPIVADRWGCWPVPPWKADGWVERAALLWVWQNGPGHDELARRRDVAVARYETYDFPPEPAAHQSFWTARTTRHGADHVGRWKTDLTDDEAGLAWTIVADTATRWEYTT